MHTPEDAYSFTSLHSGASDADILDRPKQIALDQKPNSPVFRSMDLEFQSAKYSMSLDQLELM